MKYTCIIEIEKPIEEVVKLWLDESKFQHWQDGFQSIELLEGEKDAIGSKSRIILEQDGRKMELTETIQVNDLPKEKRALYVHKHMTNTQSSRFEPVNENRTRYISEVEYTQFNGFMPKMMAMLFPGMFKKQSQKWMDQFKSFAETKN